MICPTCGHDDSYEPPDLTDKFGDDMIRQSAHQTGLDSIIEWSVMLLPFALIYAILTHWGN